MGELFPNSIPIRQAMAQWLAGIQNFYDFIFIFEMVQPGQHLMKVVFFFFTGVWGGCAFL